MLYSKQSHALFIFKPHKNTAKILAVYINTVTMITVPNVRMNLKLFPIEYPCVALEHLYDAVHIAGGQPFAVELGDKMRVHQTDNFLEITGKAIVHIGSGQRDIP